MENGKLAAAMGFFDGVHIGHGELLKAAKQYAEKNGASPAVLTFDRQLMDFVPSKGTGLINNPSDKKKIISKVYGIDKVISLVFDKKLMETEWDVFIREMVEKYNICCFIVGFNFNFGYKGRGNSEKLKDLCAQMGLDCIVIEEVVIDNQTVSSTYIRSLIKEGDIKKANKFLGHRHILTEKIVAGNQLGKAIGIPTANMAIPTGIITPKFGVYAANFYTEDGKMFKAVTNVGVRPTVSGDGVVTVESHIIDFDEDIYGKVCTVEFLDFIRPEKKFDGVEELKEQIEKDIITVRNLQR